MSEPIRIDHFIVPASERLDPIEVFVSVYMETPERTSARVTVACYGDAWTTYFGAMSGTWREFLARSSADYFGRALMQVRLRSSQRERSYAERVAAAVIDHLRVEARP